MTLKCTDFRRYTSGTLLGFGTFENTDTGMAIGDCPIHEKNGKRWVGMPARPMLDRDRNLITEGGKVQYAQVITFTTKEARDVWVGQALRALEAHGFQRDFTS